MQLKRRDFLKTGVLTTAISTLLPEGVVQAGKSIFHNNSSLRQSSQLLENQKVPLEIIALNRMCFGPRPHDFERFHALGNNPHQCFNHFVEEQLHPENIQDQICGIRITSANLPTLSKSLKQLWTDHVLAADKIREEEKMEPQSQPQNSSLQTRPLLEGELGKEKREEQSLRHQPVRETEIATWIRAIYSERQLQEVLVDFWHNHFNIFGWDPPVSSVFTHYDRDIIRPHVFGNFRQMLESVTKSPAMLFYLDGFINQSGNPNENYARELFELHTLGSENYLGTKDRYVVPGYSKGEPIGYVDGDVYEAARCFTGWRVEKGNKTSDTGEFSYFDPWHDRFQKIVLGRAMREYSPPMQDGEIVLDLVSSHPGTAHFICRKLCCRLISDQPPEAVVQAAAKVFHSNLKAPDQLRRVIRTILMSPEFTATFGQKIKRPFEFVASLIRATQAHFDPPEGFFNRQQSLGQRLFQWRTPDGYPDTHEKWGGTSLMLNRWKFANQVLLNHVKGIEVDLIQQTPSHLSGANEVLKFWTRRILGREISQQSMEQLTRYFEEAPGQQWNFNPQKLSTTVALICMSPEFQWR